MIGRLVEQETGRALLREHAELRAGALTGRESVPALPAATSDRRPKDASAVRADVSSSPVSSRT
ncbi:MAG: hypothetical protein ACXVRI_05980 [Gaiellaceae bacterium]